ncbi:MAG TPA: hypothetical protein VI997_04785, partial [Candidatus Thermoplasmatota archaeon]|nr:hypothetical protein [Candidatus Thermoplasmatota archaeon]
PGLALVLGAAIGLIDAVLTLLLGIPMAAEFAFWTLASAAAVAVVLQRNAPAPFATLILVFVVAGVFVGAPQWVFLDRYYANYPTLPVAPGWQLLAFAVAIGVVWGALTGAVAWAIARKRAVRSTPA